MREDGTQGSQVWRVWAAAAAVAAVSLFFFSPRWVVWRGLDAPMLYVFPEVNRAAATWAQVQAPWAEITDPSNLVLRWRLLFPVLAHVTGMPRGLFLALPALGGVLALALAIRVLRDGGLEWRMAAGGALVLATGGWFLVGTGWLAYFDAWCVLGMLATAFGRKSWAAAAVLAAPWVDERFVLALPLCLWCRPGPGAGRAAIREAVLLGLLLAPWLAVRAGAYLFAGDGFTGAYARVLRKAVAQIEPGAYAEGMWQGLRWAWALVAVWLAAEWRESRGRGAVATVLAAATFGVTHFAAADLTRSGAVLVPAAVRGLLALPRLAPRRAAGAIGALWVLNLVFPAKHMILNERTPIYYLHTELANLRNPPPMLSAGGFADLSAESLRAGKTDDAWRYAEAAVQLDARNPTARAVRAAAYYRLGRTRETRIELEAALEIDAALHALRLDLAVLRMEAGEFEGARAELERLEREAPADWPSRSAVRERLAELARRRDAR